MARDRAFRRILPLLVGLFGFFTPFSIAGAHISLALAVVVALVDPESRRGLARLARRHPLAKPLLAWVVVSVVAVVFAENPGESFEKLKKLALIPLVGLGALPSVRQALRPILGALLASTALVAVWGLVVHWQAGGGLGARLNGISGFYMTVAGILMVVGLVALGEILAGLKDPRSRRLLFLVVAGGAILVALLATYTRGSWIGFAAGVVFLLRKNRVTLALLALTAAAVFFVGPESGRDRFFSIFDADHEHNVVRVETWKHGLRLIAQDPWTGAGLVIPQRLMETGAFTTPSGLTLVPHSHMHNAYLQIAVSMGLPALAVFVWMIVAFFRAGRRAGRSPIRNLWEEGLAVAYPAIVIALLVNGLVEWNFGDSEILGLFYFVSGLTVGLESEGETL